MNTTTYAEAWHPDGCTIGVGGSLTCKPTVLYPNYQRSDFFTEPMPAPGIDELITQVENWPGGPGSDEGGVQIEALGPGSKSNAVASDATAFVHRKTLYHTVYLNFWGEPASEAANVAWVDDIYAAMRPYASGQAYQNYIDAGLDSWRTAYYGSNWKRLQRVKRAYDPANLLSFAQGVTPAR
jgi:FAD/FMN-containing dehydrogenase